MAVAYVSDVDKTPGTGSSFTYTSFAVSGTNPVIIVYIALNSTTATVSSVVCSAGLTSGTPVEVVTRRATSNNTYVSIWAIPAPSGTGTITVTLSASVDWQSNATLFQGADQTTPCPTGAGNVGTIQNDPDTTATLSITLGNLTADDAATGIGANVAGGDNPLHDQTRTFNNNTTSINASSGYHLGTGAVSCTWGTRHVLNIYAAARIVAATVSCALTGTVTASITESDIVAGGKTVIGTLSGDTFVAAAGTPAFNVATTSGTLAADSAGGGGGRTGNGTLTCTFPSGYTPTAGHFALMILYSDQGSGSLPTDWSEVTGSPFGAGTEKLQIFYKVLVGGESAPVTTISGSGTNVSHCANMAIYTGVGSIGAIGTPSNGTGTPMTAEAITTTANNSIVCACSGRGDNEAASGQTFNGSATGVNERCDGGTGAGSDSEVSMADLIVATSGTSTGQASSTTSATDPWVSVIIELLPTTPFADQRAAIRNGLDSAQSEAGGWDAKVKGNIPVANVVRTSNTVCTITLQAQSDYDITAQETITWTIPSSALTGGGSAVVATPTFTVSPAAAVSVSSWHPSVYLPQKRSEIIVL